MCDWCVTQTECDSNDHTHCGMDFKNTQPKTQSQILPNPLTELYCQTTWQKNHLYTQHLPNAVHLATEGKEQCFRVFEDDEVGLKGQQLIKTVSINFDEDCQTTSSVLEYGRRLCMQDLEDFFTQANNSQSIDLQEHKLRPPPESKESAAHGERERQGG